MKHIVCFSKGHASSVVAVEVARRFGKENVILLNHDINPLYEEADIKRFGEEVAEYLGMEITYANYGNIKNPEDIPSQFDIAIENMAFKVPGQNDGLCTTRLKTEPFQYWMWDNFPSGGAIIYYGFDACEFDRMLRRDLWAHTTPWGVEFPIALWGTTEEIFARPLSELYNSFLKENKAQALFRSPDHYARTIRKIEEIGISRPTIYKTKKHANCRVCLKQGIQGWYVDYCEVPDLFWIAAEAEDEMNRGRAERNRKPVSILKDQRKDHDSFLPLRELAKIFEKMKENGIPANEHWTGFNQILQKYRLPNVPSIPCLCMNT